MKLLKLIALGAAVSYGYNYLTKKDQFGKTKLDGIKEKSPEWMDKGKKMVNEVINNVSQKTNQSGYANKNY
ncbi:YtxH domain-containing protein [Pedobacter alpinus]|uniref:YtxH domain-containing protein n=1 Tax=Pedobacter alpinus TaxID=1590643 RepID=A0ABW5TVD9_9SPHI